MSKRNNDLGKWWESTAFLSYDFVTYSSTPWALFVRFYVRRSSFSLSVSTSLSSLSLGMHRSEVEDEGFGAVSLVLLRRRRGRWRGRGKKRIVGKGSFFCDVVFFFAVFFCFSLSLSLSLSLTLRMLRSWVEDKELWRGWAQRRKTKTKSVRTESSWRRGSYVYGGVRV